MKYSHKSKYDQLHNKDELICLQDYIEIYSISETQADKSS